VRFWRRLRQIVEKMEPMPSFLLPVAHTLTHTPLDATAWEAACLQAGGVGVCFEVAWCRR
jgi:hypothetical protein